LIYELQVDDLYIAKTDDAGLVGAYGEVHEPALLAAIDPAMTVTSPSLLSTRL
jgi:hypothetical protein